MPGPLPQRASCGHISAPVQSLVCPFPPPDDPDVIIHHALCWETFQIIPSPFFPIAGLQSLKEMPHNLIFAQHTSQRSASHRKPVSHRLTRPGGFWAQGWFSGPPPSSTFGSGFLECGTQPSCKMGQGHVGWERHFLKGSRTPRETHLKNSNCPLPSTHP